MQSWYLEGYFGADGSMQSQQLVESPFVLGRESSLSLTVTANSVSRRHAVIEDREECLFISDLGSSNGTYVNRNRITEPTPLHHGDVIHLGNVEMRLMQSGAEKEKFSADSTMMITPEQMSNHFPSGVQELEELLAKQMVNPAFQPIVNHDNTSTFGFELLGRGSHPELPISPGGLFNIAESVGMEVRLSELMRDRGVEVAQEIGLKGQLFVNTHPTELKNPHNLLKSLHGLVKRCPQATLMLEIHEQAITNLDVIRYIKSELDKMSIRLAYDDFGVGQSRLLELVEAAPDVLKFDMALTEDIHLASPAKRDLVQRLKDMTHELNIKALAECVSKQEEYEICKGIGFDFYQGFLFAVPMFADDEELLNR